MEPSIKEAIVDIQKNDEFFKKRIHKKKHRSKSRSKADMYKFDEMDKVHQDDDYSEFNFG